MAGMNSFFIFDGLERLRIESEVDDDMRLWERLEETEEEESIFEENLRQDPQIQRRWESLLSRHMLVRQARAFIRACAALGKGLTSGGIEDRDAALLMRAAKRVPRHLAEALIAEVNGRAHQDCEAVCVAYDIEWLRRTRRGLMQSLGALERLLVRYPAERSVILELIDQGQVMEAAVARKTIDMCALWVKKQEAERRPK